MDIFIGAILVLSVIVVVLAALLKPSTTKPQAGLSSISTSDFQKTILIGISGAVGGFLGLWGMGTMAYEVGSNVDGEILLYCACPAAVLLGPIAGILSVRYLKVEGGFAGFISFLAGLVVGSFLSFVGLVGRSES